jgi:hypothetical protein
MNKFVIFLLLFTAVACNRKPFVEHKLKFEKVADDCSERQSYFRLNSNFGGERYEFEKCLAADFSATDMSSERKGDTVVVNFKQPSAARKNAVYHITLDIDSYPTYGFMTIDGETYTITSSQK